MEGESRIADSAKQISGAGSVVNGEVKRDNPKESNDSKSLENSGTDLCPLYAESVALPQLILGHLVQGELHRLSVSGLCAANTHLNQYVKQYVSFCEYVRAGFHGDEFDKRQLVRHAFAHTCVMLSRAGLLKDTQQFFMLRAGDICLEDLQQFTTCCNLVENDCALPSIAERSHSVGYLPWKLALPLDAVNQLRAYFTSTLHFQLYQSFMCSSLRNAAMPIGELAADGQQVVDSCSRCSNCAGVANAAQDDVPASGALCNGDTSSAPEEPAAKRHCVQRNGYHPASTSDTLPRVTNGLQACQEQPHAFLPCSLPCNGKEGRGREPLKEQQSSCVAGSQLSNGAVDECDAGRRCGRTVQCAEHAAAVSSLSGAPPAVSPPPPSADCRREKEEHALLCDGHAHARPPPSLTSSSAPPSTAAASAPSSALPPLLDDSNAKADELRLARQQIKSDDIIAEKQMMSDDGGVKRESSCPADSYDALHVLEQATTLCLQSVPQQPRPGASPSVAMLTVQTPATARITTSALSPLGHCIAVGCCNSTVRVHRAYLPLPQASLDIGKRDETASSASSSSPADDDIVDPLPSILHGHRAAVHGSCFSPVGDLLATCSSDGTVRLWDVERRQQAALSHDLGCALWDVSCPADANAPAMLLTAAANGTAQLWNISEGSGRLLQLRYFAGHDDEVNAARFHPNCSYIATASSDGVVLLHDLVAGGPVRTMLPAPRSAVACLAFSHCGRYLCSAGELGVISVFDVGSGRLLTSVERSHRGAVQSLSFCDAGQRLLSTGADDAVCIWDFPRLSAAGSVSEAAEPVAGVAPRSVAAAPWCKYDGRGDDNVAGRIARHYCAKDVRPHGAMFWNPDVVAVYGARSM